MTGVASGRPRRGARTPANFCRVCIGSPPLAKRWLLGTHQGAVDSAHLPSYLNEFVFRFNRRHSRSRGMLFYRVLELAVAHGPVRYRDLVAARIPRPCPQPADKTRAPANLGPACTRSALAAGSPAPVKWIAQIGLMRQEAANVGKDQQLVLDAINLMRRSGC